MIKILNVEKNMGLIAAWRAYTIFVFSLFPVITSLSINQKNHTNGIIGQLKYVEKYQLLGGKLSTIVCVMRFLALSCTNAQVFCDDILGYFASY